MQTLGSCGRYINSHLTELQTKLTVFGILEALLEYYLGTHLCSTQHAKGHLNKSLSVKSYKGSHMELAIEVYTSTCVLWLKTHTLTF